MKDMASDALLICKKCKQSKCLVSLFKDTDVKVSKVGCQKICAGPVAGLVVDGRMEWFSRVNSAKRIAGLRMLARHRHRRIPTALEKQRVRKRSGRKPR
jgi:hypothetical protein